MKKRLLVVLLFSVLLVQTGARASADDPPPGTQTGQRIGKIIQTAIDTALPGVTSLITAIWGNRPSSDKIKKDELETALKNAQRQLLADAKQKIQPVGLVSGELLIMRDFLEPAVLANENVIRMHTRLSGKTTTTIPAAEWNPIKEDWEVAKKQLARIGDVRNDQIEKVRDLYLRDRLKRIRESNTAQVIRISSRLDNKDIAGLREALAELSNILRDITAAVGYEISDLQNDINNLSNWASSPAGPIDFGSPATGQAEFKKILDKVPEPR